jgi:hypothetical protein
MPTSQFWLYLPYPFTVLGLKQCSGKLVFFSKQWCKEQAASGLTLQVLIDSY